MDGYLARTDMHSSSVWATEVEIFAVSNMLQTPIMVFCKPGHTSGCSFCHIPMKTAVVYVQCIPKKLFIWSIYPTTMNLLGKCSSINSCITDVYFTAYMITISLHNKSTHVKRSIIFITNVNTL